MSDVADVLAIYHVHREAIYDERGSPHSEIMELSGWSPDRFFGGKMLAEANAPRCGQYIKARGRPGGARLDLEDLHRGLVRIALPAKDQAFLTVRFFLRSRRRSAGLRQPDAQGTPVTGRIQARRLDGLRHSG
jgi:hypothetical protein